MIDALAMLVRLFITVLPFAYLAFMIRTSWGTWSTRFLPVVVANIVVCNLVWLSIWLSGTFTVWDALAPASALALALLYLAYLYTHGWRRARRRQF